MVWNRPDGAILIAGIFASNSEKIFNGATTFVSSPNLTYTYDSSQPVSG